MILEYDNIVDRVVLKSRLVRWKIIAFVLLFLLVAVVTALVSGSTSLSWPLNFGGSSIVGRVTIDDVIMPDYARDDMLEQIRLDERVKALIVRINSPGGAAGASEALYRKLLEIGRDKPVVTVLGTVAASGGYMVALGGDYIVANATTLTGSIGVVLRFFNVSELAKRFGVEPIELKTSELKAAPSPFSEFTPAARESWQSVIGDAYDYFTTIVAARRNLSPESVLRIADGRVYTGMQALNAGLIDAIGLESEAMRWLEDTHSIINPVIKDIRARRSSGAFSWLVPSKDLVHAVTSWLGSGTGGVLTGDVPLLLMAPSSGS
jgi:protease-4